MSEVTDSFKADARLLRRIAELWEVNEIMDGRGGPIEEESRLYPDCLREIADRCEQMSTALFEPSLLLEKRVEEALTKMIETQLRYTEEGLIPWVVDISDGPCYDCEIASQAKARAHGFVTLMTEELQKRKVAAFHERQFARGVNARALEGKDDDG